jgi:hypothetical protein
VFRVEWQNGLTGECSQTFNAGLTARRTLVDGRLPLGHGTGISGAIWKATPRALRLGQCIVQQ